MTDDPETEIDAGLKEILDSLRTHPLRKHATELGLVAILWTKLEMFVDILLLALLKTDCATSASVTLTTFDFRDKLSAIKVMGFEHKPDEKWFDDLEGWINKIDNDLRPTRNRYIHDYWVAGTSEALLIEHKTKVIRPQSHQRIIQYHHAKPTSVAQMMAFQVQLLAAQGWVIDLIGRSKLDFPNYPPHEEAT